MEGLRNGYWFAHERLGSKARVHYGNVYDLPDELGHFDIAVLWLYCSTFVIHFWSSRTAPVFVIRSVVTDLHHADVPDDVPMLKWL